MLDSSILVVDDTRVIQHVARHILQKAGYQVTLAGDGEEALEVLEDEPHDLVITDVSMPNMDGMELLEAMRASDTLAHIPVIMMTGTGDEADVVQARSAEPDGFLTKPVSSHNLLAEVARLLHQKAM
ncbi:MAG: response regulator [Candidatus Promineifilaceae bacterium]